MEHRGHEITVTTQEHPNYVTDEHRRIQYDDAGNALTDGVTVWHTAHIDGRSYYGSTKATEEKAVAWAKRTIDGWKADEAILPYCQAVLGTVEGDDHLDWVQVPFVRGARVQLHRLDVVAGYSRGRTRIGVVDKVGRTNVTIAYVTRTDPTNITRKSIPAKDVLVSKFGDVFARALEAQTDDDRALAAQADLAARPSVR